VVVCTGLKDENIYLTLSVLANLNHNYRLVSVDGKKNNVPR
jgi:hypothetical protein